MVLTVNWHTNNKKQIRLIPRNTQEYSDSWQSGLNVSSLYFFCQGTRTKTSLLSVCVRALGVCCLLWSGKTSLTPSINWPGARGQLNRADSDVKWLDMRKPHLGQGREGVGADQSGATATSPGVIHTQTWLTTPYNSIMMVYQQINTSKKHRFILYLWHRLNCYWLSQQAPRLSPLHHWAPVIKNND